MGLYRDSELGLCLDITGPDGNVFFILGLGKHLAKQIGIEEDWHEAVHAAKLMGARYMTYVYLFKEYFPVVTIIGLEEVENASVS